MLFVFKWGPWVQATHGALRLAKQHGGRSACLCCVISSQQLRYQQSGWSSAEYLLGMEITLPASSLRRIVAWVKTKQPTWAEDTKRSTEQNISLQEAFILESSQGSSTLRWTTSWLYHLSFAAHGFSGVTEGQVEFVFIWCRLPMTSAVWWPVFNRLMLSLGLLLLVKISCVESSNQR